MKISNATQIEGFLQFNSNDNAWDIIDSSTLRPHHLNIEAGVQVRLIVGLDFEVEKIHYEFCSGRIKQDNNNELYVEFFDEDTEPKYLFNGMYVINQIEV